MFGKQLVRLRVGWKLGDEFTKQGIHPGTLVEHEESLIIPRKVNFSTTLGIEYAAKPGLLNSRLCDEGMTFKLCELVPGIFV